MFAGHVGAALAIGRADRRVNVGVLVCAALLLDVVLWLFVLLGWESVTITPRFAVTHQPAFVFPYSHGLLASIAWSALAGVAAFLWVSRRSEARLRAAALVAAAVFSHWLLDALVHAPELPIAGSASVKVGFGLWRVMPAALAVEALITVTGLYLFVSRTVLSRARALSLAVLCFVVLGFTVIGMTVAPPPPSAGAMAASSLATMTVICALACWLGRVPNHQ